MGHCSPIHDDFFSAKNCKIHDSCWIEPLIEWLKILSFIKIKYLTAYRKRSVKNITHPSKCSKEPNTTAQGKRSWLKYKLWLPQNSRKIFTLANKNITLRFSEVNLDGSNTVTLHRRASIQTLQSLSVELNGLIDISSSTL